MGSFCLYETLNLYIFFTVFVLTLYLEDGLSIFPLPMSSLLTLLSSVHSPPLFPPPVSITVNVPLLQYLVVLLTCGP